MNEKNKEIDPSQEIPFEAAFLRLENILEKMNLGTVSLDESLKLYEEADTLIAACNKRLVDAEKKIEVLIKNRNGELTIGPDQKPLTESFNPGSKTPYKQ